MENEMNPQQAVIEAARCLSCYDPPCVDACPVHVDVPRFIGRVKSGDFRGAVDTLWKNLPFPDTCAFVCPHLKLCEEACCIKDFSEPINIGALQHFVATLEIPIEEGSEKRSGKRIAIIGSGPAGLTAGKDLMMKGYRVTIFEAESTLGGFLTCGIPSYRLPREAVNKEIKSLRGLTIQTGKHIGRVNDLKKGFDAVLIAIGSHESVSLDIPGEEREGVIKGIDFIKNFNSGTIKSLLGKKVAVIGGGDVALDAARCALRLSADRTYLIYRRSFDEMPAYRLEVEDAKKEGVWFLILTMPVRITGDKGWVKSLECIKTRLGEPDESGRRRPIPIPESRFEIEVDVVIEAIGQKVDRSFLLKNPDIECSGGIIKVDEHLMTSNRGFFAAGDAVNGGSTVVQSIADGKRAAAEIDKFLGEERS